MTDERLTGPEMPPCGLSSEESMRDAKALVTFTYGPPEMAEKTTIAIATVMPLPCGPFPSIPQSTLVKTPITTKVVPQLWHQLSQMAPKTLIREWQPLICMANVPGLTPEHRRQLQRLLESLPLPSKPTENWLGETCNIWLYSLPKEIPSLIPKVASIGPWTESAWNSIICLDSESWTPEQWWHLPNSGKPYQPDTIVRLDLTKLSDPFHQTNHSSSHWKPRLVLARKRKSTILNMFKQSSAWTHLVEETWNCSWGHQWEPVPWSWALDPTTTIPGMASLNGPSWPHTLGLSIQEENGLLRFVSTDPE